MGADQQFCLRWNNFHTNITSAFESLRDDEDFVDITLACEGKQVKAHKMVLSACSPYFRSLLKGNPCQHPIVFLKDVTFANLTSILDFMYHGEVNVSHNELATFLKTAEALRVRGLAEDDKKKDSEGYNDSSSPGPPRDPPDPSSPRGDDLGGTDSRLSDSPPPHKRRRRSGGSVQSMEDTNETVLSDLKETSVKNEPQEFNDEDELLGHNLDTSDIKTDNTGSEENSERNVNNSDSLSMSRSQAAMQQLQESFGSFLPSMSQSQGFLSSHGATDMPRPSPFLEGVQGLPPGISALPGPSMSQGGASQDTSQGEASREVLECRFCGKHCSSRYNLRKHERDLHLNKGSKFTCQQCRREYGSLNSLQVHRSVNHPTGIRRRHSVSSTGSRPSSNRSASCPTRSCKGLDDQEGSGGEGDEDELLLPDQIKMEPLTLQQEQVHHNLLNQQGEAQSHTPQSMQHHHHEEVHVLHHSPVAPQPLPSPQQLGSSPLLSHHHLHHHHHQRHYYHQPLINPHYTMQSNHFSPDQRGSHGSPFNRMDEVPIMSPSNHSNPEHVNTPTPPL